ncbi:TonB-linked outer membrane protein, SusC/RagA family [Ohtaekwangia koreensis]|uniref:TonB-linked outer membrane protein, SusC/RagA family n=2 Tax=Ohtaekwangia koreensis TaxID=688867 RepID=A0A1T5JGJ7_9BACT|nr:TonB-linked outer membrane protein, SusC/RagA family [Ohtaekwangia koreensis]
MKHLRKRVKTVLAFALCFCFAYAARSQSGTISGTVTSKGDGSPLPGVNVIVKGTSIGTSTDADGKYTINAGENAVVIFSFIGYTSQEVPTGNQTTVDVVLVEDATQLGEIVVTALGITKEAAKVGYSISTVNGEQLNKARETNVALSLEGRVAGLNVKGTSSGPGGTAKILLRGMPSMNSGGSPLFVINGVPMDNTQRGNAGEWGGSDNGDGIGNLNPDDIETMTVLKGQSASALYGARASNGVIIITTKKGKKGDFSVEYNMNYMADKAIDYTDFQYVYGQGLNGAKPANATEAQATSRMSWGAKLDGSQVIQFDGNQYAYSASKNNIKNFYRTGSSFTNTVSVSKGSESGSFRLSLSNLDNSSIVRNSGLDRKTINLNLEQKITNKLSVNLTANYVDEQSKNRPQLSDGPMNANNGLFLANNIDERILAPGYNSTTGFETRYGDDEYATNPWFVVNQYVNNVGRKRLISSITTRYDFTDWLYAQGRVGYDQQNDRVFKVEPWGTAYTTSQHGNLQELSSALTYELNVDGLLGVSKNLTTDLKLDALVGANLRKNRYEYERVAGSNFVLPYLYTLSNVLNVNTNPGDNYKFWQTEVHSAYYSADLEYKNFLTLTTTGRYDKYSTLPTDNREIFTPSVSAGFIFSELANIPSISFGKLRASWAKTSGDLGEAYKTAVYYSLGSAFNGIPTGSFSTDLPNVSLKPFTVTEVEFGTDIKFFQNRLGLDVSWYTRQTKNEIMPATFSSASGYTSGFVGTGSTKNTGLEIQLTGTPIKTNSLTWNITANVTTVKNTILETDSEGKNQTLGSNRGTLGNAVTAYIKGFAGPQILAYDYKRSANGDIIVDASGLPVQGDLVKMGSVLPKVYGGVTNEFSYKSVSFSFLIDYNFGNKVLSATEYYSILRGLNKMTLTGREEGITTGVLEGGAANTTTATPQDYYKAVAQRITSSSVVDGDFIKLRQVTLGYTVPASVFERVPVLRSVQVSFVARNLAFLMRKADNIDPEASFGSNVKYYGIEGTSLPSTRSYGVNLNFKFK